MANLFMLAVVAATQWRKTRFVRKTQQVVAAQEKFLLTLLRTHQHTEWGRQHSFAAIETIDQFRQQIPILPYSSYEPFMERIANGEPNVLTPDPVIYLNLTSGSTGKQKLIPVTKRSRRMLNRANQTSTAFAALCLQQRGLALGKMLMVSSVQLLGCTNAGIEYGPVSVGTLRMSSKLNRQVFPYPFEALQPADNLARHYVCLLFALRDRHLGIIGANFPILALRLCDYLECYAEDLIRDLEAGTIAEWLDLEPELRTLLESRWSADVARAAELRQILKTEGCLTPKSAWKHLSLVMTAKGGTSDFYFERFPTYFGNTPIFGGIYASAEATFGVYHDLDSDGAVLAIESGFFEFIPEDQWEVAQPQTLLPAEVTPGERYRILVTNYSGLCRYDIGDVVEVTGFFNQTPIIAFRHRLGGLLSSTTEKTTEFHAVRVMQQLQQDFNLPIANFCITLSEHEVPAHYLVNVELLPGHQLTDPQAFVQQFDRRLKEIHVSYEVKRRDQVPPPHLRILAAGSFATVRQRLLDRGVPESQLKFPHITEDRRYLEGLTIEREEAMQELAAVR
ncbi:GH3 auxin-responsive promoter family protein [Phormidium tenue FACHB-886]|nr:GH3 auxin-responsive promoter family protein [Phormidium tenue FACHB-886]